MLYLHGTTIEAAKEIVNYEELTQPKFCNWSEPVGPFAASSVYAYRVTEAGGKQEFELALKSALAAAAIQGSQHKELVVIAFTTASTRTRELDDVPRMAELGSVRFPPLRIDIEQVYTVPVYSPALRLNCFPKFSKAANLDGLSPMEYKVLQNAQIVHLRELLATEKIGSEDMPSCAESLLSSHSEIYPYSRVEFLEYVGVRPHEDDTLAKKVEDALDEYYMVTLEDFFEASVNVKGLASDAGIFENDPWPEKEYDTNFESVCDEFETLKATIKELLPDD